ncbi:hypothetical protein OH458_10760 [Vibrio sp. MarTm2]|uniref:hypothetical protein n=1 Tax=Vibrio sp. MarTm2 TaxID=2998831 RepID=UPI0022CD729B|nr:hypothetical protein [Vibrio sp. MarTm2]MDA0128557.1 hypothetical protein [Vibrio sp. MarTm2]
MIKLLIDSANFLRSHRGPIFTIVGPFFLAMSAFGAYLNTTEQDNVLLFSLYLAVYALGQAFYVCRLIKYMASVVTGSKPELSVSLYEWLRLFCVHLMYGLAVLVGLMVLIIPGIYLSARYGFAEFESVLNKRMPFEAMSSSWGQTQPYTSALMLGALAIGGGGLVMDLLLSAPDGAGFNHLLISGLIAELVSSIVVVLMSVFYFRVYVSSLDFGDNGESETRISGS